MQSSLFPCSYTGKDQKPVEVNKCIAMWKTNREMSGVATLEEHNVGTKGEVLTKSARKAKEELKSEIKDNATLGKYFVIFKLNLKTASFQKALGSILTPFIWSLLCSKYLVIKI